MVRIDFSILSPSASEAAHAAPTILDSVTLARSANRQNARNHRDFEAAARNEIKRRFPELTYVDCYVRLVNGQTLHAEIKNGMEEAHKSGHRLSSRWWSQLRLKWTRVSSPESMLTVTNATDFVSTQLIQCLAKATSSNTRERTSQPLQAWLCSVADGGVSQKALIGLFRHSLSCHPSGRHLATVINIVKAVSRLRLYERFPRECQAMSEHWDCALCSWHSVQKKAGIKDNIFMDQNLEFAALVLNYQDVRAVSAASEAAQVSVQLQSLCSSSALGARVYGSMLNDLAATEYLREVMCIVDKIFVDEEIGNEKLSEAFEEASKAAEKWEYNIRCGGKATTACDFDGTEITLPTSDAASVASAVIWTWLKATAVHSGQLTPLWFEKEILQIEESATAPKISERLLMPAATMRRALNEEVAAAPPASGDLCVQLLQSKQSAMSSIDPMCDVEIALARALNQGPGRQKLFEKMQQALPDKDTHVTLNEAVQKINSLIDSPLFKFCSVQSQSKIEEVAFVLKQLQRGAPPNFVAWSGDSMLKKLRDEVLPLFLEVEFPESSTHGGRLRARAAASALMRQCREAQKNDALELSMIQPLSTFDYILKTDEQQEVQGWLSEVWSSAGLQGASAMQAASKRSSMSSVSSTPSAPLKKKPKVTTAESLTCSVADLFA